MQAQQDFHDSVFRRTAILLSLVGPAYIANFGVLYYSARLLAPDRFGVFYVANTVGSILFSASLILNMYLTRHLAGVELSSGKVAVERGAALYERKLLGWGIPISVGGFLALLALSTQLGTQSWAVILMVVLDVFTSYVGDIGRAVLQSRRRTIALGMYTLTWMVIRLGLCIAGILLFHTVWGAFAGMVLSIVIVYGVFRLRMEWSLRRAAWVEATLPRLASLAPAILGYGSLITVSHLDVLMSYLLLTRFDLGIYSASSVFPKAVLSTTLPVLQMLYPLLVGGQTADQVSRRIAFKSCVAIIALTATGVAMLWLLSGWVCGGRWGVSSCDVTPFNILLPSIVPLALLRFLVIFQFARRRDWTVLWIGVPTVAYLALARLWGQSIAHIATAFSVFSAVVCIFCLVVWFFADFKNQSRASLADGMGGEHAS